MRSTLLTRSNTGSRASVRSSDITVAAIRRIGLERLAESRLASRAGRTTLVVTCEMIHDFRALMQ